MIWEVAAPEWLATDGLLAISARRCSTVVQRYKGFVADGIGAASIRNDLNGHLFLGDEAFVARSLRHARQREDVNIPRAQRRPPPPPLEHIAGKHSHRDEAIVAAHASGGYSYQQIAEYFGMHFTTVGRIVRAARKC